MTVAELIAQLENCPKDSNVYLDDIECSEVDGVEFDVVDMETRVYIFTDSFLRCEA